MRNECLNELEGDPCFHWIEEAERSQLRAEWVKIRIISSEQAKDVLDRLEKEFPVVSEQVRETSRKLSTAEQERTSLLEEDLRTLQERHARDERLGEIEETLIPLRREYRQAQALLLSLLSFAIVPRDKDPVPQRTSSEYGSTSGMAMDPVRTDAAPSDGGAGPSEGSVPAGAEGGDPLRSIDLDRESDVEAPASGNSGAAEVDEPPEEEAGEGGVDKGWRGRD